MYTFVCMNLYIHLYIILINCISYTSIPWYTINIGPGKLGIPCIQVISDHFKKKEIISGHSLKYQ